MSAAALAHDALLPRAPGGNGPGLVLALGVHAALLLALTTAVDWRTRAPEVASAELWASVPQVAAPPPPPPPVEAAPAPTPARPAPAPTPAPPPAPPRPSEADIANERAERRKAEAAKLRAEEQKAEGLAAEKAAEKTAKAAADKQQRAAEEARKQRELLAQQKADAEKAAKAEKAEEDRLARQRDDNLRRIMAQAGNGTSAGSTAQSAGPSASYAGRLVALVRGNLVYTGVISDNTPAEVEVTATASGAVISRRLLKSSGHKDWDDAVLRAIDRTPTLPRDTDGRVPSPIIIAFRPRE